MNTIKRVLFSFLTLLPLTLLANNIFVYDVKGEVFYWHNNKWDIAKPALRLEKSDSLKMGEYASITLLEGSKKPYPAQFRDTRTVEEVLKQSQHTKKPLIIEAFQGLISEIVQPLHVSVENYNENQGAADRGSGKEPKLAAALVNKAVESSEISFQLIDATTGALINDAVQEGTPLIAQVTNKAPLPLYVNIIDLSNGEMAPVLPIGKDGDMRHLLIPANATVRLDRKDMRFSMFGKGTDQLILLADEEPFDVMQVIRLVNRPDISADHSKVYISRQAVRIK